jgi:hypothetical protein
MFDVHFLSTFRIPTSLRGRFQPVEAVRLTGRRVGPYVPYGPEAAFNPPIPLVFILFQYDILTVIIMLIS